MAVVALRSADLQEQFLDELDSDGDVDLAVPDTWVFADDFEPVPEPLSAANASAAGRPASRKHGKQCSAHPACAARGLVGDCCPAADGMMLSCCSMHGEPATVSVQTYHGTFLAATGEGGVFARSGSVEAESKLQMVLNGDGTVSLRTAFGTFLTVEIYGWIAATAHHVGDREKFTLAYDTESRTFSLETFEGNFVSAEPPGWVLANRPRNSLWEGFRIRKIQGPHQRFPNDPDLSKLWAMHSWGSHDIDAPEAWKMWTGEIGGGIIVAVIDTGVDYNHEDLKEQMWVNRREIPGNGVDDDGNGFVDDIHGVDFANEDGDPFDDQIHGTHCSGTIAGIGNNGIGIAGIAWRGVRVMALKFLKSDGSGRTSDAIRAIEYAIAHGARILSNSWGGGGSSSAMRVAIERAEAAGLLFIAAAGNSGTDNDVEPHYPSGYEVDNLISVASTTSGGSLSTFSCFGNHTVHIAAPGSQIYSTAPGSKYQFLSGTSMATPHVTGVAALVWMYRPQLSMQQVKRIILQSVERSEGLEDRLITGGLVNAKNALETAWAFEPPRPPTHAPQGVLFEDVDPDVGSYSGVVTIKAAANESDIDYYRVYFVSAAGFQLEPLGDAVPATGEPEVVLALKEPFAPPTYATALVAVSGRSKGEMPARAQREGSLPEVPLRDYCVPALAAGGASWGGDADLREGWLRGTLRVRRARQERTLTGYRIFWRNETGARGALAGFLPAAGFSEPACAGSACEAIGHTREGPVHTFAHQHYGNKEEATISLSGPGWVSIRAFVTEEYYDTLTVAGRELSGDLSSKLPMEIALPEASTEIKWTSDPSLSKQGWAFTLVQSGEYASFHLNSTKPPADGLEIVSVHGESEFPEGGVFVKVPDFDRGMPPSPAYAPVSLSFVDMDPAAGKISGVASLSLARGAEAAGVSAYRLDLADADGRPMGASSWRASANGTNAVAIPIPSTELPAGAVQLIARAQSSVGLGQGFAATRLVDTVPTPPADISWSGDKDGRAGWVSGEVLVHPGKTEAGIEWYVVYWLDTETLEKGEELARAPPKGFGIPVAMRLPFGTKAAGKAIVAVSAYPWGEMEGPSAEVVDLQSDRRLQSAREPRKPPRAPPPMAGAEPWISEALLAQRDVLWTSPSSGAQPQVRSSIAMGLSAEAAAQLSAREALREAMAAELRLRAEEIRVLRILSVSGEALVDFAVEPPGALAADKAEAHLIRLSHGGRAAARLDAGLRGLFGAAGLEVAGRSRVAAPKLLRSARLDAPRRLSEAPRQQLGYTGLLLGCAAMALLRTAALATRGAGPVAQPLQSVCVDAGEPSQ